MRCEPSFAQDEWRHRFRETPRRFRRTHMTVTPYQPCADCPPVSRQQAALDALGDATQWAFATFREWRRRSRDRAQLARLDDRLLRDIGLSHAEREFLANQP